MNELWGVDTSNLNGDPSTYIHQQPYASSDFVIVQAIPRGPTTTAQQLYVGQESGLLLGIYTWLWDTPSWRLSPDVITDQSMRLKEVPQDVTLNARPWLDLEDNQSSGWQQVTVQQRIDNARRALWTLDQFAGDRKLPPAGVYTSRWYQSLLYGGWDFDGRPLWLANYNRNPGSLLGGQVVGHQWTSTPMDSDVFLESEFIQKGDPMSLNVGQGLRDAMSANDDHPISDEFTYFVNSDGTVIEAAYGLKGRYVSSNASGQWENAGPWNA